MKKWRLYIKADGEEGYMGTTGYVPSALILQKPNFVMWELGVKKKEKKT